MNIAKIVIISFFVNCLVSCRTEKNDDFGPEVNIFKVSDGSLVVGPVKIHGLIYNKHGNCLVVFDDEGRKRIESATAVSGLHLEDVHIMAGNRKIGEMKIVRGLGGVLMLEGIADQMVRMAHSYDVIAVERDVVPMSHYEAMKLLKERK